LHRFLFFLPPSTFHLRDALVGASPPYHMCFFSSTKTSPRFNLPKFHFSWSGVSKAMLKLGDLVPPDLQHLLAIASSLCMSGDSIPEGLQAALFRCFFLFRACLFFLTSSCVQFFFFRFPLDFEDVLFPRMQNPMLFLRFYFPSRLNRNLGSSAGFSNLASPF